ncbi:MAG: aspartate/glutamate racemase family protein [Chloroflexi bacterium]|nr:aspartate/glutamate racemase family protein [Chloroflexota bacterium]
MKILCMLPAGRGVYPEEAEERRLNLMRSYTTAATQVDADYMPNVSGFSPWGGTPGRPPPEGAASRAAELSVRRAVQAEQEGYDAFCPFGTLDIGVRAARQQVKIAVIGQTEACLMACALLDRRFAWVTYMPGSEERNLGWARQAGVEHLLVASLSIGIPNSEYPQRRGELLERFVACAAEARAKGAELIGVVAMSICPTEYSARELSTAAGLPVLDALGCQIATAEWWHRTALPTGLLR